MIKRVIWFIVAVVFFIGMLVGMVMRSGKSETIDEYYVRMASEYGGVIQEEKPWNGSGMLIPNLSFDSIDFILIYKNPSYESDILSAELHTINKMVEIGIFKSIKIDDEIWGHIFYTVNGDILYDFEDFAWIPLSDITVDSRWIGDRDIFYCNAGDKIVEDYSLSSSVYVTIRKLNVYSNFRIDNETEVIGKLDKKTYLIPYLETEDQLFTNKGVVDKKDVKKLSDTEKNRLFGE